MGIESPSDLYFELFASGKALGDFFEREQLSGLASLKRFLHTPQEGEAILVPIPKCFSSPRRILEDRSVLFGPYPEFLGAISHELVLPVPELVSVNAGIINMATNRLNQLKRVELTVAPYTGDTILRLIKVGVLPAVGSQGSHLRNP